MDMKKNGSRGRKRNMRSTVRRVRGTCAGGSSKGRGDSGIEASEGVGDGILRIKPLPKSMNGELGIITEDCEDPSVSFSNGTGYSRRGGQLVIRSLKF